MTDESELQPSQVLELPKHHASWLKMHPNRTVEWLKERFRDGFDVHHIDGDHDNNAGSNLVLIEHLDHMRLHGAVMDSGRMGFVSRRGRKRASRSVTLPDGRVVPLNRGERTCHVLAHYRTWPDSEIWDMRSGIRKCDIGKPKEVPPTRKEIFSKPYSRQEAMRDMWKAASKA